MSIFEQLLVQELGASALERLRAVAALHEAQQRAAALEQEAKQQAAAEKTDGV